MGDKKMTKEELFDEVLMAIENCLATPLVLGKKEDRKVKLEQERKLTYAQERLYAPNSNQLFKQFSI